MKTISVLLLAFLTVSVPAQRARDLGVPFEGTPGTNNSITDVAGVEVGYSTIIRGEGKWKPGEGPVRTGVTVVFPRGKASRSSYPANYFIFNGDGETTGLPYLEDFGRGSGPIGITNTSSVGVVRDAIGEWNFRHFGDKEDPFDFAFGLPIVGETWDGGLNDIQGLHVKREHVFEALDSAKGGPTAEGNVGGGTGMVCYWFKGGTGTSSRVFEIDGVKYTLGVLVQANFGRRPDLTIAGVPVGKEIADLEPSIPSEQDGSIIVIVGTDAPLSPQQLRLIAKRVTLGVARTGSIGNNTSGDIFVAFSTARGEWDDEKKISKEPSLDKSVLDPVFRATVESTEEAIVNALVAARDMEGINGNRFYALPHDRLKEVLKKYNRIK